MGPDNKAIVSSRTPTFLSMRSAIDQSKSLVFYESKRVRSTPLQSIAKIIILQTDVLLLMNEILTTGETHPYQIRWPYNASVLGCTSAVDAGRCGPGPSTLEASGICASQQT